jgi:hypothetical protein
MLCRHADLPINGLREPLTVRKGELSMKRLLVLASTLFLFACGGGGGGVTDVGGNPGGDSSAVPGGGTTAQRDLVSVYLPPEVQPRGEGTAQRIMARPTLRTHARLVVTKRVPKMIWVDSDQPLMGEICDWDDEGNAVNCRQEQIGWVKTEVPSETDFTVTQVAVGPDAELETDGSGSVSVSVPPGEGYTLFLVTYLQENAGSPAQYQYLLQCAQSLTFNMPLAGPLSWADWTDQQPPRIGAELILQRDGLNAESIVAGDRYSVTVANRSSALRDRFYARQGAALSGISLANWWFVHEDLPAGSPNDAVAGFDPALYFDNRNDVFGASPLRMTAPLQSVSASAYPEMTFWVQGQFFASDAFLRQSERSAWNKWTYNTSPAQVSFGPLGEIIVNPPAQP